MAEVDSSITLNPKAGPPRLFGAQVYGVSGCWVWGIPVEETPIPKL